MLTHLLNTSNLQSFSFQCEDEPVEAREIDSPLPCAIAGELMAT
jgi:hypothetical protein